MDLGISPSGIYIYTEYGICHRCLIRQCYSSTQLNLNQPLFSLT